jgi:hypothetical protein
VYFGHGTGIHGILQIVDRLKLIGLPTMGVQLANWQTNQLNGLSVTARPNGHLAYDGRSTTFPSPTAGAGSAEPRATCVTSSY